MTRLLCLAIAVTSGLPSTSAFSTVPTARRIPTQLFSETQTPAVRRRPTSKEDILKQANAEEPQETIKIFDDSLYEDMLELLLTLERRVKDGPLSMADAEDVAARGQRVLQEMKQFEARRVNGEVESPKAYVTPSDVVIEAPSETSESSIVDTSNDEGPAYDGTGGMGLAKGTVNTYVIPGMDEMSPEEYQKALQESISNRQKDRMRSGSYGNRPSWDYLKNLG